MKSSGSSGGMQKSHCDICLTPHFHHSTNTWLLQCGMWSRHGDNKCGRGITLTVCVLMRISFYFIRKSRLKRKQKGKGKKRKSRPHIKIKVQKCIHTFITQRFGADSKAHFHTRMWYGSKMGCEHTYDTKFYITNKSNTKFQSKKFTTPHGCASLAVWVCVFIYLFYGFFCFSFSIASPLESRTLISFLSFSGRKTHFPLPIGK